MNGAVWEQGCKLGVGIYLYLEAGLRILKIPLGSSHGRKDTTWTLPLLHPDLLQGQQHCLGSLPLASGGPKGNTDIDED